MFSKKLEKRIEKLEIENEELRNKIIEVRDKEPMYTVKEEQSQNGYSYTNLGATFSTTYITNSVKIPITDVIKLILDKMGLEVKSVPAQKEKFVLGKKGGEINGH